MKASKISRLALILGALPLAWAFMQVPGCGDDETSGTVPKCSAAGEACASNAECCNRDCEDSGVCDNDQSTTPPSTPCKGPGAVCASDGDCCNGDCEDNGACDDDQGPEPPGSGGVCKREGEACSVHADCCDNECENGRCD